MCVQGNAAVVKEKDLMTYLADIWDKAEQL